MSYWKNKSEFIHITIPSSAFKSSESKVLNLSLSSKGGIVQNYPGGGIIAEPDKYASP